MLVSAFLERLSRVHDLHETMSYTRRRSFRVNTPSWLRGPAVEHRSLADVLSLSCARLVADG